MMSFILQILLGVHKHKVLIIEKLMLQRRVRSVNSVKITFKAIKLH